MGVVSDIFSQLGSWLTDALNSTIGNWAGGVLVVLQILLWILERQPTINL